MTSSTTTEVQTMLNVSDCDLKQFASQAKTSGQALTSILAAHYKVGQRDAARCLASRFAYPVWESAELHKAMPVFADWPLATALQTRAVLVITARDEVVPDVGDAAKDANETNDGVNNAQTPINSAWGVISDPFDTDVMLQLEHLAQHKITFVLATPDDIHAFLNQQEASLRAVDSIHYESVGLGDTAYAIEVLSLTSVAEAASPAVKLVNSTLYDALRANASDVHLESTPTGLVVRYRIDGVLDDITQVQGRAVAEQTISRLKVLSELDIAERRTPQDGRFQVRALGRLIDLRVSVMPSIHGEDAVIRILDKQAMIEAHGKLSLEALGFDAKALATLNEMMLAPYGMLLVTGPTGSGKTTTLYAALAQTQTGREKIITIEDPVEYQLPGVLQIPVNEKKGLTFARGLRSILRHDPDKIMVGEIRDKETAEIAVQSALTGHLVLTTVHANNVFDVFGRFTHMGLDPYSLVSALNGIWAQRLLRLNCKTCSVSYTPTEQELARFNLNVQQHSSNEATQDGDYYIYKRGQGCGDCRGTGYKGRRAVAEFLVLDDELREMIVQRQSMKKIKELARSKGTRSLLEAALEVVREGETTLEEVRRVTLSN
jgi:general secretion pathway protein E